MIQFFKKLYKLVKVIDHIDIKEDADQIQVVFKKNLLISSGENILFSSGKHMVVKTGSFEPGLLFLNPSIENVENVGESVRQSLADRDMKNKSINTRDYGKKNCDI